MKAQLVMFKPDGTRRDFPILPAKKYIIGRKESCDLRIPLSSVSREHAAVYYDQEDEELVIEDLGSSNGTFVNNERVENFDLCPGDVIVVGNVPFQVVIDGQPKNIKPIHLSPDEPDNGQGHGDGEGSSGGGGGGEPVTRVVAPSAEADALSPDNVDLSAEDESSLGEEIAMPDESGSFFEFDPNAEDDDED
ncbi:MAG: FHA domain-containing protein [Planctomycetes bacterium]|nr:FHA domain-containing protein [Planctomycetota bacterium]